MVVCFQDNTDIVVYFALVCSNSAVGLLNWIGGKKSIKQMLGLSWGMMRNSKLTLMKCREQLTHNGHHLSIF